MLGEPLNVIGLAVLAGLWLFGAYSDIRSRRLPNWLAGLAFVTGLIFAIVSGGFAAILSPLGHSVIAVLVGMLLFRIGFIGAGDAKYYAGLAAWFALPQGLMLLINVALAGVVLVIAMLLTSGLRREKREERRRTMSELPYGVAIACGAAFSWIAQLPG